MELSVVDWDFRVLLQENGGNTWKSIISWGFSRGQGLTPNGLKNKYF